MDNCINEYKNFLKNVKRLSDNTVSSYLGDVGKFADFIASRKTVNSSVENMLISVTELDINAYILSLESRQVKESSISRAISTLKNFYGFLYERRDIESNPTVNVKSPKVKKQDIEYLTDDELRRLLNYDNSKDFKGIRDKAIIELLYATGMKASELIGLKEEDINVTASLIKVKGSKKYRMLPIDQVTFGYIREYLAIKNQIRNCKDSDNQNIKSESLDDNFDNNSGDLSFISDDYLFTSTTFKSITRQGLWKIVANYGRKADISNLTPLTLRHTFAKNLLENGGDIDTLAEILGVTNVASLQVYLKNSNRRLVEVYKTAHIRPN